jgi:hypothetical protein
MRYWPEGTWLGMVNENEVIDSDGNVSVPPLTCDDGH